MKRAERRFRLAEYEELRARDRWLRDDPAAPFEVQTTAVVPPLEDVRTVLVFKPDEIGDAVYALSAVAELRRIFPQARLSLVCRGLTAPLYERSGLFDEIATYEPGSRTGAFRRRLRRSLATLSDGRFDLGIFLRTYPGAFREFLAVPCRARVHPLDPRMRSSSPYRARVSLWRDERRHQALQMLEIVSFLSGRRYGYEDVSLPALGVTDDDRTAVERLVGADPMPYMVVHPFAKDETRRYPMKHWPAILESISEELGVTLVSIGGPEDPALEAAANVIQAQGKLSLMQTAELLRGASGFLGTLSGPAHLAAALGVPTFTIMSGHSLPSEWAPLGDSRVLRADVPCAPCHQRTCPVYGLACLTALRPAQVASEAIRFLARASSSTGPVSYPNR